MGAEQKAKGEALRVKKALEGEINELEIGLDHANKANSEGLKSVKRYQAQLKETIQLYEDEARARSQIMEQVGISERKAAALSGELEESKALMDSSERSKRQLEMEIAEGRTAVNNMQVINGRDMTAKRGLRAPSTPSRLRSMLCSALPRMLRRSPRRRWLTPPVLLMSSVLSRITLLPRHLPSSR